MKAAIIEGTPIDPERDAGSRSITDLRDSFVRLGFQTKILIEDPNLEGSLDQFGADVIFVSRPITMIRARHFREIFKTPVVYWAMDFHSKRLSLAEEMEGSPACESLVMSFVEQLAISSADLAVFPTKEDSIAASRKYAVSNLDEHRYFSFNSSSLLPKNTTRENSVVFIGSPDHTPNLDGLRWFLENCWPVIRDQSSATKLRVIGAWKESEIFYKGYEGVEFTGQISEHEVQSIMSQSLIGISPLRFGAGLKRKTLQYLNCGLALVSTDFGLQGLPKEGDGKFWIRQNTDVGFIDAITSIIQNPELSKKLSTLGSDFVKLRFSEQSFDDDLKRILRKVGLQGS